MFSITSIIRRRRRRPPPVVFSSGRWHDDDYFARLMAKPWPQEQELLDSWDDPRPDDLRPDDLAVLDNPSISWARTLEELLVAVRAELARWGRGDMHYPGQTQEQSVLDVLAQIDAALGFPEPTDG